MKIKISKNEVIETDDHPIEALEHVHRSLSDELLGLEGKMLEHKARARRQEPVDDEWYARAKFAEGKLRQSRLDLNTAINARRKKERMQANLQDQVPRHFMAVAKQYLSETLYNELLAMAVERHAQTQKRADGSTYTFEVPDEIPQTEL